MGKSSSRENEMSIVYLRGGGELASGIALRLWRCGFKVVVTELSQPLAVRRLVSFAQAVFVGEVMIEGVKGRLADDLEDAFRLLHQGVVPVLVDPDAKTLEAFNPQVMVDARMTKQPPDKGINSAPLVIGAGPGFIVGENCHAVVETKRGHFLGHVYWSGSAEPDTGLPEPVSNYGEERVLRAPADGVIHNCVELGSKVQAGTIVAEVNGKPITAKFSGILRGLLHEGIYVKTGLKVGDVDPRMDERHCYYVSDKALAIGGGVLEGILSKPEFRKLVCL